MKKVSLNLVAEQKEFVDKDKHETRVYWSYKVLVDVPVLGTIEVPVTFKEQTAREVIIKYLDSLVLE